MREKIKQGCICKANAALLLVRNLRHRHKLQGQHLRCPSEVDEVRVWSAIRTQAEIAANMNGSVSSPQTNLAAYWPIRPGTTPGILEDIGNNYDVTLNNTYSNTNFTSGGAPLTVPGAYKYDANGNLIMDKNKGIAAITYNHLNLPQVITIKNTNGTTKGTITYTYDAAGNKLEKVTDEYAASTNNNTSTTTTSTYIGGALYESKTDTDPNTADYANKL